MFNFSDKSSSFGLSCRKNGLALAGVPLLRSTEDGFAPRPWTEVQWLLSRAYDIDADVSLVMGQLSIVAGALNAGEIRRATTEAVLLKLPELDWDGAARIAHAEDALTKFDPDEPRDWHGRWGTGTAPGAPPDDGALREDSAPAEEIVLSDDWVGLPPGERDDHLGDFLEWIANAKPEDEPAIRAEIKRVFYDVGDTRGGDAFNRALSESLAPGVDRQDREEILRRFEPYTRMDPAEAAQLGRDVTSQGLIVPAAAAIRSAAETAAARQSIASSASAWLLGWAERGKQISKALGQNLADNFPVIDRFFGGIATSIKSIDLNAATYQNAARLLRRINGYVDQVAKFSGKTWGDKTILEEEITGRALNLAIP
jgi:hypothetical protein